jgi:hypothetical protein
MSHKHVDSYAMFTTDQDYNAVAVVAVTSRNAG